MQICNPWLNQPVHPTYTSTRYVDPLTHFPLCFSYQTKIHRPALDFDFEKVCSVCLSNINIYGCLVCGKYFQGRGRSSNAYAHSIHEDHHVFINLETKNVSNYSYLKFPLFAQSCISRCMYFRMDTKYQTHLWKTFPLF